MTLHYRLQPESGGERSRDAERRWLLVLHGIFGSGANWRSWARRLSEERPDWGVIAVDLREHGRSRGFAPPHSLEACARDLLELETVFRFPVAAVSGHSFGGKVALRYAALRTEGATTADGPALLGAWVLDCDPGSSAPRPGVDARAGDAFAVLAALETVPIEYSERTACIDALRERGIGRAVAEWLAMNLHRTGKRYRLEMDLPALRALLESHRETDLWPDVARLGREMPVRFLLGGRSGVVSPELPARLARCREQGARGLDWRVLPEAGHWLHVDDLAGSIDDFVRRLP